MLARSRRQLRRRRRRRDPSATAGLANSGGGFDPCSPTYYAEADVLVLGAGAAGIAAAKHLHESGVSFLLLEGTERVGGRVKDAKFRGFTVEHGANWMHSLDENPLWPFAKKYKLQGTYDTYDDFTFKMEGGGDSTDEAEELIGVFEEAHEKLLDVYKKHCIPSCSLSMREALTMAGWSRPRTRLEEAVELFRFEWMEVLPSENISFFGYMQPYLSDDVEESSAVPTSDKDWFVTDQRGYAYLLRSIAKEFLKANDVRLRFKEVVTLVEYGKPSGRKVLVHTERGSVYAADRLIITFSNNVLTFGDVRFQPPLPHWKLNALRHMPTAAYTKHFIDLQQSPIDHSAYVLMLPRRNLHTPDPDWRLNVAWQNLATLPQFANSSLVLMSNFGQLAVRSGLFSSSESLQLALERIRATYPTASLLDSSEMAESHYCWTCDRFARGSYATPLLGLDASASAHLRADVDGLLFFAGDGCNPDNYGTVHSAFDNGLHVASLVAASLKPHAAASQSV